MMMRCRRKRGGMVMNVDEWIEKQMTEDEQKERIMMTRRWRR